jgi:hypothetical protein
VVDLVKAKVDTIVEELEKEKRQRAIDKEAAAAAATSSKSGPIIEEVGDEDLDEPDSSMSAEQFASALDQRLAAKREKLLGDFEKAKRAKTSP